MLIDLILFININILYVYSWLSEQMCIDVLHFWEGHCNPPFVQVSVLIMYLWINNNNQQ